MIFNLFRLDLFAARRVIMPRVSKDSTRDSFTILMRSLLNMSRSQSKTYDDFLIFTAKKINALQSF